MNDLSLDRVLCDAFASGPRHAPTASVDAAIADARGLAQRRPLIARLDSRAWPLAQKSGMHFPASPARRLVLLAAILALALTAAYAVGARLLRLPAPEPLRGTTLVRAGTLPNQVFLPVVLALTDGRVVVGGYDGRGSIARIVDLKTGTSHDIDSGLASVNLQASTLLLDGRVFLLGWEDHQPVANGRSLIWIFDPITNQLSAPIATRHQRFEAAIARLADGRVLLAGGLRDPESGIYLDSTEVFDPSSNSLVDGSGLPSARSIDATIGLLDGDVLLVGGFTGDPSNAGGIVGDSNSVASQIRTVERFDPVTGRSKGVGSLLDFFRGTPHVLGLPDGRILIIDRQVGPQTAGRHDIDKVGAHVFDPTTNTFDAAPDLPHTVHAAAVLRDGRVVIAGSWQARISGAQYTTDAWLGVYDPASGVTVESRNPLTGEGDLPVDTDHAYGGAALLPDGRVVLVGEVLNNLTGSPSVIDVLAVAPR